MQGVGSIGHALTNKRSHSLINERSVQGVGTDRVTHSGTHAYWWHGICALVKTPDGDGSSTDQRLVAGLDSLSPFRFILNFFSAYSKEKI